MQSEENTSSGLIAVNCSKVLNVMRLLSRWKPIQQLWKHRQYIKKGPKSVVTNDHQSEALGGVQQKLHWL